ncbi:MAG: nitroreductase family deazaflavin-dependent oxidoreductase [Anaerolineales bacterium]|nr:nitroreductase family deazaflavin-dependent oxidoreductase [Anaerolineales bacterium]MCZ2122167.1 nitroreductase family deazaflavin-dependent oxidoreductase [Anaerolineales bacterium]
MNEWNTRNQKVIDEFRATGGKVSWFGSLLLLHTKGAKSGQERINPVVYMQDGERWLVVASKGGAPTNPDWFYNIQANPLVTVEVGAETLKAQAHVLEEPERTQVYEKIATAMPSFAEYRSKTNRVIPVVALTRAK